MATIVPVKYEKLNLVDIDDCSKEMNALVWCECQMHIDKWAIQAQVAFQMPEASSWSYLHCI